ncbi:MAG: phage holin family protein [Ilumatobacter sp.]|nr:phage holin family protein [bacterium]MDG1267792.1 phage holin family protein [Ilumatobacter sp.]
MKLRMIRLGLLLVGNAIGLWIASLILNEDMRLSGLAFVVAVVIFTVLVAVLEPLVSRAAERWADFLGGASALIATGVALILTSWISDGLSINGIGTWLLATFVVWAAAAVIGIVLVRAFAKENAT